ncbi:DUF2441 domain-containing protein [Burkholderia multivorans]|uniref:DUF2441 domain-containing protein n=1 Tax=Burkholderia multivorans TaxID=87883 RepID=UPI00158A85D8|nr:DUF2441 domain-containing protein [Burkholderia multivorans]MDN8102609.1 hypothetical protein [Burkholderia multivorans]
MPTYFHVDRRAAFVAGQQVQPRTLDLNAVPDLATHFSELFPHGVSAHGYQYLNSDVLAGRGEPAIELIWEYVRRAFFPDKPSRFIATCAWQTLQEAVEFRSVTGAPAAKVWMLEADAGFIADMNLLHAGSSTLRVSQFAHRYWSGLSWPAINGVVTPAPRWEVLLTGAITVVGEA